MKWNQNGLLVHDSLSEGDAMLRGKSWYDNGSLKMEESGDLYKEWFENGVCKREIESYGNGVWKRFQEWDDKGGLIASHEFSEDGRGTMEFLDGRGKQIAKCRCNEFLRPYEGSFLSGAMEDGKRRLISFNGGKAYDITEYSQGNLPDVASPPGSKGLGD